MTGLVTSFPLVLDYRLEPYILFEIKMYVFLGSNIEMVFVTVTSWRDRDPPCDDVAVFISASFPRHPKT
jgi:hypothetical protein